MPVYAFNHPGFAGHPIGRGYVQQQQPGPGPGSGPGGQQVPADAAGGGGWGAGPDQAWSSGLVAARRPPQDPGCCQRCLNKCDGYAWSPSTWCCIGIAFFAVLFIALILSILRMAHVI